MMFRTNHNHFPWDLTRLWPSLQSKQKTSQFLSHLLRFRRVFPVVPLAEKRKKEKKKNMVMLSGYLKILDKMSSQMILSKTYNPRTDIPQWFIQLGVIFPEQLLNISAITWVYEILGTASEYHCKLH